MITLMARLYVTDWDRFQRVHDDDMRLRRRRDHGNLTHEVLRGLDDQNQLVFLDTWNMPQDSDDYYHSDIFQVELDDMGAELLELIKLEKTTASSVNVGGKAQSAK